MSTSTSGDGALPDDETEESRPDRAESAPDQRTGFRGFAARRPIAAFLILVFSIAYPLMFLVVLAQHEVIPGKHLIDRMPIGVEEQSALLLTFFALLPSAMFVTWAAEGSEGLRRLFSRVARWRFGVRWWVFILTALPVLTIISGLLLGDRVASQNPGQFIASQLPLLLINFFLINIWEETAWAGVMQTRLERRRNAIVAALITAVPFGFAHWPLAFLGEFTIVSASVSVLAYILLGALMRPLAGLTMRAARDSVLAFALVHTMFNRTNNPGGLADTVLDGTGYEVGFLIVLVLLTAMVGLILRGKLGPAYRGKLEQGGLEKEPMR